MTKAERILALIGVSIVAAAILLLVYVSQSNPADARAAGCASQRSRLAETLDQVRFSTAAAHSVSTALTDTAKTREQYGIMIAAAERQLSRLPARRQSAEIRTDLSQASSIVMQQLQPLQHAQAILAHEEHEVGTGIPLVNEASRDLGDHDCSALTLTLAASGWPKDRLLGQLADVAHINAEVSDRLEVALTLILRAQDDMHSAIAAN